MIRYLIRRVGIAIGILFVLSVMMYGMLDLALDPLDDLRQSTQKNKAELIAARVRMLRLDEPWWVRYWDWLTSFIRGDWGEAWRWGQPVNALLGDAIATSVQLVFSATIVAILLGVTVGLISALRQYTTFDYSITFVSFVLYSLPVFWVAVLLKQFLAIGFNDYLNNPTLNWGAAIAVSIVSGLFWTGALGGDRKRKLITFASATAVTLAVILYVVLTGWVSHPKVGVVGIAILGAAAAFAFTVLFAGMSNKRALYSALTTAALGVAAYVGVQWLWYYYVADFMMLLGLFALALALGFVSGLAWGGPDRMVSARGGVLVALFLSVVTFFDRVMQTWPVYNSMSEIKGRPIGTIGSVTPGLRGDFWILTLDRLTHLLLPSVALVLISFATYTRYQRGSMLEVLNQDYIRTARAKGLPERVVIVRHALRNAMLPLASIIPVDLLGMVGGAVMTETIFGWSGMGKLFIDSMHQSMIDPIMAYVMIIGAIAMAANLLADFLYAVLDPRIRVNA